MRDNEHNQYNISSNNLLLAIILNIAITVAEAVGGLVSGSMALISDATHNFSDVISLVISWFANRLAKKEATERQTFGFRRSEVLAAFINSLTLIIISVIIIIKASERLVRPSALSPRLIILLALLSIFINGISALFIRKDSHHNLNMKSAYIHLIGDMLTSVAVLAGGVAIKVFNWYRADTIFSILIAIYLLWLSWKILRSSLRIIMQFTPEKTDINKITTAIEDIRGIKNIHHVHVWQINDHDLMFEAHVDLMDDIEISSFENILVEIKAVLLRNGITHSTIQPEYSVDDKKKIIY
jgi:cobalt-zinc-cadmium efflux system protein